MKDFNEIDKKKYITNGLQNLKQVFQATKDIIAKYEVIPNSFNKKYAIIWKLFILIEDKKLYFYAKLLKKNKNL